MRIIYYLFRSITLQVVHALVVSMIQKIHYQCVINVQIIIHICVAINVHHVNIRIFSHLFHSVNIYNQIKCIEVIKLILDIEIIIHVEILPLVEFYPENDIPEQEVERLLMAPPKTNMEQIDPFVDTMINEEVSDILPLTLDRDALRALDPTTILIAKWPKPFTIKYYRNLMPEWQISMCPECLQVYY